MSDARIGLAVVGVAYAPVGLSQQEMTAAEPLEYAQQVVVVKTPAEMLTRQKLPKHVVIYNPNRDSTP